MKKFAVNTAVVLYLLAGVNHFWHPGFYLRLVPPCLPFPQAMNYLAGGSEIILATMVAFNRTRYLGAIGIVVMLLAFIPAHIYFIKIACPDGTHCAAYWLAWFRLLIIHPLLIGWAWGIRK